jgi:DNA replication and repair protein RecF
LGNDFEKDHQSGFTHSGPHRGELAVNIDGRPASDCLSRGQQKVFITALHLAQATVLHEQTGRCSLFLLDDLGSELDARNRDRVLELLLGIRAQVFVTAIEEPALPTQVSGDVRRFHVKHGSVSEVV